MNQANLALLGRILDEMGMQPESVIQMIAVDTGRTVDGLERPPLPETMFGLECNVNPEDHIAFGDIYEQSGFSPAGLMTIMVTRPDRPLGGVAVTKEQARALRDWLSTKVDE